MPVSKFNELPMPERNKIAQREAQKLGIKDYQAYMSLVNRNPTISNGELSEPLTVRHRA